MQNRMKTGLAITCGIFLLIAATLSFYKLLFSFISYMDYRDYVNSGYYDYENYYEDDYYEDDYYEDDYYEDDYYEDDYYEDDYHVDVYDDSAAYGDPFLTAPGYDSSSEAYTTDTITIAPQSVEVEYVFLYPSLLLTALEFLSLILLAIAMLRRKKDIFAGICLMFYGLLLLVSIFFSYGFTLNTLFMILEVCFLAFLALVCFTGGKFQLKGASVLYLIIGLVLGISHIFTFYQTLRILTYSVNFQSILQIVVLLFQNFVFVGVFSFLGAAFVEYKNQPVPETVPPHAESTPYMPAQSYIPVPPVVAPARTANYDQLRQLKGLLDEGVITEEEFEEKKKQLLQL